MSSVCRYLRVLKNKDWSSFATNSGLTSTPSLWLVYELMTCVHIYFAPAFKTLCCAIVCVSPITYHNLYKPAVSLYMCVCVCVCLSVCLSDCLCVSVRPSVRLSVCTPLFSDTTVGSGPNLAHMCGYIWEWFSPLKNCAPPARGDPGEV